MSYAGICVDITHEKVDKLFTYEIPAELENKVQVGSAVIVPFGRGNTETIGYVLERYDKTDCPREKLKSILRLRENAVSVESRQIKLAAWMKQHYGCSMAACLRTVLPVKQTMKAKLIREVSLKADYETVSDYLAQAIKKKHVAKKRLIEELLQKESLDYTIVTGVLGVSAQTIRSLSEHGIVQVLEHETYRSPIRVRQIEKPKALKEEQQAAYDAFQSAYDKGEQKTYLLYGVTGSGKTEVYMQMIDHVLRAGKQAIVLIPEIALTYQTMNRFYNRFGDQVALIHSKLSQGERYDQFERAKKGLVNVMIGPRSALFTPFENLGLIVIDEEHEGTYKSDVNPKFHARETAIEIASEAGASVVLGSATPSVETYQHALDGTYTMLTMTKRATGASLPNTHIVDMRKEMEEGNRLPFSRPLIDAMQNRLAKGEQIMLFMNRRGYEGFVSCRTCGYVVKCPHCDISLTEHTNGRLVCHYCGFERPRLSACPECQSKQIRGMKAGTQKIESQLKDVFGDVRLLRMDADTTRKKDDHEKILQSFANGEADILLGTQMIVKGHDFPNVTLVGVLMADLSLSEADFRGPERTFQIITQAAGRAGRGEKAGDVFIQTYQPEHYAIETAASQDYEAFFDEEIVFRDAMAYPPSGHMLAVLLTSKKADEAQNVAGALASRIRTWGEDKKLMVLGPQEASVSKISDVYRYIFYIKSKDRQLLETAKDRMELFMKINEIKVRAVSISFDFDPMNTY